MQGIVLAAPLSGREKLSARGSRIFNELIPSLIKQYTQHVSIPIQESSFSSVSLKRFISPPLRDLKHSYGNRGYYGVINTLLVDVKPAIRMMFFRTEIRKV